MAYIYCITNKMNDDCYIGSAINFKKRKNQHLSMLKRNVHHCYKLQKLYNKYGFDNLKFDILQDNISIKELIKTEQKYLDELKPRLNTSKFAITGFSKVKDKICVFDLNGNHIDTVISANKAAEKYNLTADKIREVCNLNRRKTGDFTFRWEKYFNKHGIEIIKSQLSNLKYTSASRPIFQVDLNSEIIKQWPSAAAASDYYNVDSECIRLCASGKTDTSVGFKWKFVNEKLAKKAEQTIQKRIEFKINNKKNHKRFNNKRSIPIMATHIESGKLFTFPSTNEAVRQLNLDQSGIWLNLNGRLKRYKEYKFTYINR